MLLNQSHDGIYMVFGLGACGFHRGFGLVPRRRLLRDGLALAGLGLVIGCGATPTLTVQPARAPRVGWLILGFSGPPGPLMQAFSAGLSEQGYVDGHTIVLDHRYAEGRPERLRDLAGELVDSKVDLVLAGSQAATLAAKDATATIPIITVLTGDPVELGLVASLARPGGNITGLSTGDPRIDGKRLQLLKETMPRLARVAVLADPGTGPNTGAALVRHLQGPAQALGVQLLQVTVGDANGMGRAFDTAVEQGADAVVVYGGELFISERARVADLAIARRLPTLYARRENVEAGGLMSYAPNVAGLWHRAATYVDKILKGAKPADLPMEQPTVFDFIVNLKSAEAIGLTIPRSVLQQATEVIQ
jgi:putative ABC transport system substrate-binding protein